MSPSTLFQVVWILSWPRAPLTFPITTHTSNTVFSLPLKLIAIALLEPGSQHCYCTVCTQPLHKSQKYLTFPAMSLACSSRHSCCRASICLSFARRALACSVKSLARWRANAFLHSSRLEPFRGTGAVT